MVEPGEIQHLVMILTQQRNLALDNLAETGAKLISSMEKISALEVELQIRQVQIDELLRDDTDE